MKAKVLIFSLGRRGAAPNQTFELARAMIKQGELDLSLCISHQSDLRDAISNLGLPTLIVSTYADIKGWEVLATLWRLPLALLAFGWFVSKQRPDLVLCPMGHMWNPLFLPLMRLMGARYALMVHDGQVKVGDYQSAPQRWNEVEVRRADILIAMTDYVRLQLAGSTGRDPESILVVPLGPFEAAAGNQASAEARAEKIRQGGPRNLLFFGRILEYKGLDILLEAFGQLQPAFPDLNLLVAGSGDIGPYQARIDSLRNVKLDLRYIPEEDIPAIFSENDIVILPYREATQSGVIAVAQTAGVPVVVTPVGGLVEQIQDGVTGIISTDTTSESLALAIRRLLDDRSLYGTISVKGQEHSRSLWNIAARDIALLAKKLRTGNNARSS
jgi:glycosyltransferase involved in cell wall biosynthesis